MERVFKWLTAEGGSERAANYTEWFATTFDPHNFEGIDRMLACFIKYCATLHITPKQAFLSSYLKVDGKKDIRKYNVRTETMASYDYKESSQLEEAFRIISESAIARYAQLQETDLEGHEFKVDMYEFMNSKKSDAIQNAMMKAYPKLMDGSDAADVSSELKSELAKIEESYDTDKLKNIDLIQADSQEGRMKFICPTGLPCVDGDLGGIYTHIMVTLTAQPGGGKTRMALVHWVYQVLTVAKKDVLFYETELTKMQVMNILIAYHITRVYNGRYKITDKNMNKEDGLLPEQQQIYEAAKIDLFESGKYGNFIYKDECIVEKMEDEILGIIRDSGNLGLVAIDYMGLCRSVPLSKFDRVKEQYEVITEAYEIMRRILKNNEVSALCINQYNDKGIDAAYAGKPIRSGYVQGGHIVQRHTDYDLSMTFTEEQELANVRMLSVSKRRGTAGFKNVMFRCDLSVSIFRQEVSANNIGG